MRTASILALVLAGLAATPAVNATLHAQQHQHGAPAASEELTAYAKAFIAIGAARDAIQAELAQARNKTTQAQQQLQDKLREQIAAIMKEHALTDAAYQRLTYLVSSEPERRKQFDEIVAQLTGQPSPAQQASNAAAAAQAARPGEAPAPGPQDPGQPHIGHVTTSFGDTPNRQGLLPTAIAEARTAAQHAALAARNTTNLDAMKLHAGHVLHAIDPGAVASGPGQGYGVRKAATAVAAHIELAAKTPSATAAVTTHATHIATSARNTVRRADEISALVKKIQAATTAAEGAALLSQLVSMTEQLIAGADANADGRVTWQDGEGGLQHVEEHVNLLLRG